MSAPEKTFLILKIPRQKST